MIHDNMLGANHHQSEIQELSSNVMQNDFGNDRETPNQLNIVEKSLYDLTEEADLQSIESNDLIGFTGIEAVDMFYTSESTQVFEQLMATNASFRDSTPTAVEDTFPILEEHDRGGLNFDLHLNPNVNGKSSWYYSPTLQKVFIKLDKTFYIEAVYSPRVQMENLHIRAMMVFTEDISSPVQRCANHMCSDLPFRNNNSIIKYNVLRSENPKASYTGKREGKNTNDRLSVLIPLSSTKLDDNLIKQSIALKFVCQNSCLNRKSTAVIFTLEDSQSSVLGKKIVNVKVCSCPKRDKEKDEERHIELKRPSSQIDCPPGKKPAKIMKIKEEPGATSADPMEALSTDTAEEISLKITMPNFSAMRNVFRYAFDHIAGLMALNPSQSEKYSKYLKSCKRTLDQLNGRED